MPSSRTDTRLLTLPRYPEPPLIRTRYPILLMHGFGTTSAIGRRGIYHTMAMALRAHGVWAYAPNVAPYHTIQSRAAMWAERLAYIRDETGAEKVNLIAHSMGGLDARYLISNLGEHKAVASLTTIASPHRGTALAHFVLNQPTLLLSLIMQGAQLLGELLSPEPDADFMRAVEELRPKIIVDHFNPATPDHPDVLYWSYGGEAGRGTAHAINPVLIAFNRYIYKHEGVNDGFVSTTSAPWGTYCGTLPADHAQQINIGFPGSSSFQADAFYVSIAQMLATRGL